MITHQSRSRFLAALAVLLLGGLASAQRRVWIVDGDGRPGTDFRVLPKAVAAAKDGDVIRVRRRALSVPYRGFATSKALSILAESEGIRLYTQVTVHDLARGKDVVLRGFAFSALFPQGDIDLVTVRDCRGRVLIEQSTMEQPFPRRVCGKAAGLFVKDCADVSLHQLKVSGAPGIRVQGSSLHVANCDVRGVSAWQVHFVYFGGCIAMDASGSMVDVAGGKLTGGSAPFVQVSLVVPAREAVRLDRTSRLTLRGDASTVVRAGEPHFTKVAVSAILGTGQLVIDPSIRPLSANGAPPIAASLRTTRTRLPALAMTGAGPGGTARGQLFSPRGDFVWIFHGLVADRIPLPILGGSLALDPRVIFLVAQGRQGATEHFSASFSIPKLPGLVGFKFGWQAVSGTVRGLRLSNAVLAVHF